MPGLGQQAGQDQILVSPGVWKSSLFPNPCSWNRQHHPKLPPLPRHAARGLTVPPPQELSRQERGSAGLSGSAEEVQGRGAAVNNRKGRAVAPRGPASPASCGQQQLPREALPARGPAEPGLEGSWCHARSTPGLGKSGTSAVKDRGTEGQSLLALPLRPCSWKVLSTDSKPSWEMAELLQGAGTKTNPGLLLQPRARCHGFIHFPKASRFLDIS